MLYKDFLSDLDGCPFCQGKNQIILDGEYSYLTYALAPYHKHHLIIVPKRHVESVEDLTKEELKEIEEFQKKGVSVLKKLGYTSVTMLVREGNGENKSIDHVHYHVVPAIMIGDLDHYGQERRILSPEEVEETLGDISPFLV